MSGFQLPQNLETALYSEQSLTLLSTSAYVIVTHCLVAAGSFFSLHSLEVNLLKVMIAKFVHPTSKTK